MSNPCIGCGTDTGPALEPWCEACVAKAAARIRLMPMPKVMSNVPMPKVDSTEPIKKPAQRLTEAIYVVREVSANEVPASRASWQEVADAVDEYDHGLITASVVRQSLQKLVLRHAADGLSMRHVRAVRIALDAVEDLRVLASSPLTKTTSAVMILARRSVDDALRDVVDQTA